MTIATAPVTPAKKSKMKTTRKTKSDNSRFSIKDTKVFEVFQKFGIVRARLEAKSAREATELTDWFYSTFMHVSYLFICFKKKNSLRQLKHFIWWNARRGVE